MWIVPPAVLFVHPAIVFLISSLLFLYCLQEPFIPSAHLFPLACFFQPLDTFPIQPLLFLNLGSFAFSYFVS